MTWTTFLRNEYFYISKYFEYTVTAERLLTPLALIQMHYIIIKSTIKNIELRTGTLFLFCYTFLHRHLKKHNWGSKDFLTSSQSDCEENVEQQQLHCLRPADDKRLIPLDGSQIEIFSFKYLLKSQRPKTSRSAPQKSSRVLILENI